MNASDLKTSVSGGNLGVTEPSIWRISVMMRTRAGAAVALRTPAQLRICHVFSFAMAQCRYQSPAGCAGSGNSGKREVGGTRAAESLTLACRLAAGLGVAFALLA